MSGKGMLRDARSISAGDLHRMVSGVGKSRFFATLANSNLSIILMIGIKESAGVNTIIVFLKVSVVVVFIAIGWAYMNPANHEPLIPPNTGTISTEEASKDSATNRPSGESAA